jgi:hypothetical protein
VIGARLLAPTTAANVMMIFVRRVDAEVGPAPALDLRLHLGRRCEGILHNRGKLRPAAR